MEKNPFSLYDFLGYFIPGAIFLFIAYLLWDISPLNDAQTPLCILNFKEVLLKIGNFAAIEFSLVMWIVFILFSYLIGHFIAYLSSLTVEKFSIWVYGYPSDFLLKELNPWYFFKPQNRPLKKKSYIWRVPIVLFLTPIVIYNIVFAKVLNLKSFFIKGMDSYLVDSLHKKLVKLLEQLNIYEKYDGRDSDLHRIIDHYVYEKQVGHRKKLDNYVALYGFLRSATFIMNTFFIYALIYTIFGPTSNLPLWGILLSFFILGGIVYIFFMAFMKFYRRYTLEGFMCLIADDTL